MRDREEQQPFQATLFEDGELAIDSTVLVTIAPQKTRPSALQRTFNQLTGKIRQARAALAEWEACETRYLQRVARELEPVLSRVRDAQRRLVRQLAELLEMGGSGVRLSRRHRSRVRAAMLSVIDDILSEGPDPELEALHDRYSEISRADLRREETAFAQDILGEVFGEDILEGLQAGDVDELLEQARVKMAERAEQEAREQEERAARRRSRRGRSTKAEQAAQRKAQADRDAGLSLRETYRKLASALHPDRELDQVERERKTTLMQRVNTAYERRDLLELLALQIEIEQIDATHLSNVPEARLHHYNHVLREQLATLKSRIAEWRGRFEYGLPSLRSVTPRGVDRALGEQVAEARTLHRQLESDLEALADPRRRRAVLDALPDDEEPELPEFLEAFFVESERRARPKTAGRKGAKRKRRKGAGS